MPFGGILGALALAKNLHLDTPFPPLWAPTYLLLHLSCCCTQAPSTHHYSLAPGSATMNAPMTPPSIIRYLQILDCRNAGAPPAPECAVPRCMHPPT